MTHKLSTTLVILALLTGLQELRAQDQSYRPGLAFREDWKEIPAETPVNQNHVNHPDLILGLYGPGKDSIKKSHHDQPFDDPYYIWSGTCLGTWALALEHGNYDLDLSRYGKIRWRSKQYGFRQLHIILGMADGTWLVSRQADGFSGDWRVREFLLADLDWYTLDIEVIHEIRPVADPDLGRVRQVGFTDLMPGGGSEACSRLDWIEVYGYIVERKMTK
ncbi:MAG: hypothetical protein V2B15_17925 [Bacteroidota bacterium]